MIYCGSPLVSHATENSRTEKSTRSQTFSSFRPAAVLPGASEHSEVSRRIIRLTRVPTNSAACAPWHCKRSTSSGPLGTWKYCQHRSWEAGVQEPVNIRKECSEPGPSLTELGNTDHDSTEGRSLGLGFFATESTKHVVVCSSWGVSQAAGMPNSFNSRMRTRLWGPNA